MKNLTETINENMITEAAAKLEKMKETGFDEYCRELGLGKFVYSRYV